MTAQTPATQPGFNTFAILSIIFVWFAGIFGLVFGYIALSQIKKTGERGRGLAIASVVLGWIAVVLVALWVILFFMLWNLAVSGG